MQRAGGSSYTSEGFRDLFQRKAQAASRHRAAARRQLGMRDSEAEALAHLARAGRMTPSQLGDLLGMTSGGVTALLHRLERAGHVTRGPHPTDRRSSILEATPQTVQRVQELYRELAESLDRVEARLSPNEHEVVGRYLEEVVQVSQRAADEAMAKVEGDEKQPSHEPVEIWT